MRHFLKIFLIAIILALTWSSNCVPASAEPRVMSDEIFEMLTKGYTELSRSKLNEAQAEFANVIKADFDNPYANNNLAVLMEKQGRLHDAMTYLNIGEKFAEHYLYKVDTSYLIGGICAAVKPENATVEKSPISQIIAENKKKLAEKMGIKAAEASTGEK